MARQEDTPPPNSRPRPKRVSISELPRLSRANTLDIELHYLKLHLKHYCKRSRKFISKAAKKTGIALKVGKITRLRHFWEKGEGGYEDKCKGGDWDVYDLSDGSSFDGYCTEI
ncbi:hypothetical protein F4678DRAFT_458159 [Xylaria arbuscula]|nr:hypothetical protein F4678DRAFT_458159 [Xylaria arbuscula]